MNRSRLILWVVAAVAAIGVTTAAVTVANASGGGGRDDVLSQDDVSRQLADQTAAPPGASDPASPAPSGAGESRTLRSQAAQLVARCDGSAAYLEAWSPNPGYRVDEVVRGPAPQALLWVESDSFDDVQVLVQCRDGLPEVTELAEPDDHDDGDDGRSGPGGDRDDGPDDDHNGGMDDDPDDRYDG